jgi:ArsR family metal-binding transcriptional regulator
MTRSVLIQLLQTEPLRRKDIQKAKELLKVIEKEVIEAELEDALSATKPSDADVKTAVEILRSMPDGECPVCGETFEDGYYHCSEMKLWQHMGNDKKHKKLRKYYPWTEDWLSRVRQEFG